MAAERASWERVAALREAIRRDVVLLRSRFGVMYDRARRARAAQRRWMSLVALGLEFAQVLRRRRAAGGER